MALDGGEMQPVCNPANGADVVGHVRETSAAEVDRALWAATEAAGSWAATPPGERAALLERAADLLEADMPRLLGLLTREAGKTCANGVAEVREAVDFLRYYAAQVRNSFSNDTHRPLGPVVCISPWNFPLAIFTGQVAAALAAGNTVLAKPAEQTPLIAAEAVRVLWRAGVPREAVQLLPGRGETVGALLVGDERVKGVMFTGSTEVARILQRNLAGRLDARGQTIPLIAETGGQNAMIADSSALVEQVVGDVLMSAFDSAGQRCSALRVLCVQEDVADRILQMLKGAMAELRIGHPDRLAVDVGPVIDADARDNVERHIERLRAKGRRVFQAARGEGAELEAGTFVLPTVIELDDFGELQREVFGPVLHFVRYARHDLDRLLDRIDGTGYGLTLGLHTRIDETIAQVVDGARVGNIYVNRNMVGAMVGVQPFGGEGLSGTGPKAGGPLYLYRLLSSRPGDAPARAVGGDAEADAGDSLPALRQWAASQGLDGLMAACDRMRSQAPSDRACVLDGPTGERKTYFTAARERVLCLAADEHDLLIQLAAVCAVGARAIWPAAAQIVRDRLPKAVQAHLDLVEDWEGASVDFDVVLHHGDRDSLRAVSERIAQRQGAIVGVVGLLPGDSEVPLERLVIERALSVNTAAAGGNASLMSIG